MSNNNVITDHKRQNNSERHAVYEEALRSTVLDAIRALGIVNLHGRPAGAEFAGPCPCCGSSGPRSDRFSINTRKHGRGVFNCRQCGIKGRSGFALACAVLGVDARERGEARDRIVELLTRRSLPPFTPLKPFKNGSHSKPLPLGARLARTFQYPYHDADGRLLFEVYRRDYRLPDGSHEKRILKRRPDGHGGWHWFLHDQREDVPEDRRLPDLPEVPYRLPQVLDAIAKGQDVFVGEGEKVADALVSDGRCGTTARDGVGGIRHWEALAHWFAGASIVLLPDNDTIGRTFMTNVAWYLQPFAKNIDEIDIYEDAPDREDGRDFADWQAEHRRAAP
jgi:hypothetical protein